MLQVAATSRGLSVEDGGYLWRGELRLWDNELLMGWYAANDGAVRSKGTMYFVIHAHGINLLGRWVGMSYDGKSSPAGPPWPTKAMTLSASSRT
jgi:hypothetical protein